MQLGDKKHYREAFDALKSPVLPNLGATDSLQAPAYAIVPEVSFNTGHYSLNL